MRMGKFLQNVGFGFPAEMIRNKELHVKILKKIVQYFKVKEEIFNSSENFVYVICK